MEDPNGKPVVGRTYAGPGIGGWAWAGSTSQPSQAVATERKSGMVFINSDLISESNCWTGRVANSSSMARQQHRKNPRETWLAPSIKRASSFTSAYSGFNVLCLEFDLIKN
jgi:hypothetical protein